MVDFLLRRDEDGQGLAEYALILALIAIVAIARPHLPGHQISGILSDDRRRRSRHAVPQGTTNGPSQQGRAVFCADGRR